MDNTKDVEIIIRKRGRPKGSRDVKQRRKRAKIALSPDEEAVANEAVAAYMTNITLADDEEFVSCDLVFSGISLSEAYAAPDADRWIEAIDLERAKLEACKSWKVMEKDEAKKFLDEGGSALPLVVLLTRKRCGRYKARAVVLGNRWSNDEEAPTYSPVVSSAANRLNCISKIA